MRNKGTILDKLMRKYKLWAIHHGRWYAGGDFSSVVVSGSNTSMSNHGNCENVFDNCLSNRTKFHLLYLYSKQNYTNLIPPADVMR